ncbi:MAG: hypothetical protein AAFX06_18405 [Planctomycetota bacterium]
MSGKPKTVGPYAQEPAADLPQFYLWQLMLLTTAAAFAFATARVIDSPTIRYGLMLGFASAPMMIYGFAAVVAPDTRMLRRRIRATLLLAAIGLLIGAGFRFGSNAITPFTAMLLIWMPQFILLKFCSACRASFDASHIS